MEQQTAARSGSQVPLEGRSGTSREAESLACKAGGMRRTDLPRGGGGFSWDHNIQSALFFYILVNPSSSAIQNPTLRCREEDKEDIFQDGQRGPDVEAHLFVIFESLEVVWSHIVLGAGRYLVLQSGLGLGALGATQVLEHLATSGEKQRTEGSRGAFLRGAVSLAV